MRQARLCRLTIGLLVHSQCVPVLVGIISAQNARLRWALSDRAIIPLPRRDNASSTIEGKGNNMTTAYEERKQNETNQSQLTQTEKSGETMAVRKRIRTGTRKK